MDEFFDKIGDAFADGILSIVTDSDYLFFTAISFFLLCVIIESILAYITQNKKIDIYKGIFIGFLFLDITISLTSVMLCKLWFAILISIISSIVIPIYEKNELEKALNKDIKISFKKYLIYFFATSLSIILGNVICLIITRISN